MSSSSPSIRRLAGHPRGGRSPRSPFASQYTAGLVTMDEARARPTVPPAVGAHLGGPLNPLHWDGERWMPGRRLDTCASCQ